MITFTLEVSLIVWGSEATNDFKRDSIDNKLSKMLVIEEYSKCSVTGRA